MAFDSRSGAGIGQRRFRPIMLTSMTAIADQFH